MPALIPNSEPAFELPLAAIRRSVLACLNLQRMDSPPQIHGIRDIIRDTVLPRLERSIGHIEYVLNNPNFVFHLSPRMQGDMLEETREADYTDFLTLHAALKALKAGCHIAIAYDVSMEDYTSVHLLASLEQDSDEFLALYPDGDDEMVQVPGLLLEALQGLDAAIDALFAESDEQEDDLIKIGSDDLHEQDLLDFQNTELVMMMHSLQGPHEHTYDWDSDSDTPDAALTVDLNAFFMNPVSNWKMKVPPYTVRIETVPYETTSIWQDGNQSVTVTAPVEGQYQGNCYSNFYDGIEWDHWCSGPDWLIEALAELLDSELDQIQGTPGWTGDAWIDIYFWGYIAAGVQEIDVWVSTSYEVTERWADVAVIRFEAETVDAWLAAWPDPTLNGLFPNASSAEEILTLFGWEDSDWAQELILDWADDGFGWIYDEPPLP